MDNKHTPTHIHTSYIKSGLERYNQCSKRKQTDFWLMAATDKRLQPVSGLQDFISHCGGS